MRNRPYPSEGWDTSLFEEPLETADLSFTQYEQRTPCHILLQLVNKGEYEQAENVRAELEAMGLVIQPDVGYADIAKAAFMSGEEKNRVQAFISWWTLVPEADTDHHLWNCQALQEDISSKFPDPATRQFAQFALHAVHIQRSQNFAMQLLSELISTLATKPQVPDDLIIALTHDFREAALGHYRERCTAQHKQRIFQPPYIYYRAIRSSVYHNRPRLAAALLKKADSLGGQISERLYAIVARHLARTGCTLELREVDRLWRKQGGVGSPVIPVPEDGTSLHETLAGMRNVLRRGDLPLAAELKGYIRIALQLQDIPALNALRLEFHDLPQARNAIPIWARAEMSCYMETSQTVAVLAVFAMYYHHIGIPSVDFVSRIVDGMRKHKDKLRRKSQQQTSSGVEGVASRTVNSRTATSQSRTEATGQSRSNRLHEYIPSYLEARYPSLPNKLIPGKFDNVFVWQALAGMAPTAKDLEEVYQEFLDVVDRQPTTHRAAVMQQHLDSPTADITNSTNDTTSSDRSSDPIFDAVHFNIFITSFISHHQDMRTAYILDDMLRRGIRPNMESYTTIAKALVHNDRHQPLGWVFKHVETVQPEVIVGLRGIWDDYSTYRDHSGPRATPSPTLVLHTAALHHAIDAGRLSIATYIHRRLLKQVGYKPGTHRPTDLAFQRRNEALALTDTLRTSSITPVTMNGPTLADVLATNSTPGNGPFLPNPMPLCV